MATKVFYNRILFKSLEYLKFNSYLLKSYRLK